MLARFANSSIKTLLPQMKIRGKEFLQCYNHGYDYLFAQRKKNSRLLFDKRNGFPFFYSKIVVL